jgi:hypothetical protein
MRRPRQVRSRRSERLEPELLPPLRGLRRDSYPHYSGVAMYRLTRPLAAFAAKEKRAFTIPKGSLIKKDKNVPAVGATDIGWGPQDRYGCGSRLLAASRAVRPF